MPGFAVAALGGLLLVLARGGDIVSGTTERGTPLTARFGASGLVVGVLLVLFCGALAAGFLPRARTGGLVAAFTGVLYIGLTVIYAKTDERYGKNPSVNLQDGGKLAIVAAAVCLAGFVLAVLVPRWPDEPGNARAGIAISALGMLFPPIAPVGIAIGMRGLRQADRVGRTQSLGAVLVGSLGAAAWVAFLVLGVATFTR